MYILNPITFKPSFDFNQTLMLKDCSERFIKEKAPHVANLVSLLKEKVETKEFLTIDFFEQVFKKGSTSCVNPGWHVDGKNNNYLLICWGEFRTEFLTENFIIPEIDDLREKNTFIDKQLNIKDLNRIEIPESCPVIYSSNDIHRGRIITKNSKRVFLRLCFSDYLKPKNKILFPNNR